jgi:hypothetical protein
MMRHILIQDSEISVMCPQVMATGKNILGHIVVGSTALLLIAEKVRISANLPGNHAVKTVTVSKWFKIPLQVRLITTGWNLQGRISVLPRVI